MCGGPRHRSSFKQWSSSENSLWNTDFWVWIPSLKLRSAPYVSLSQNSLKLLAVVLRGRNLFLLAAHVCRRAQRWHSWRERHNSSVSCRLRSLSFCFSVSRWQNETAGFGRPLSSAHVRQQMSVSSSLVIWGFFLFFSFFFKGNNRSSRSWKHFAVTVCWQVCIVKKKKKKAWVEMLEVTLVLYFGIAVNTALLLSSEEILWNCFRGALSLFWLAMPSSKAACLRNPSRQKG